MKRSAILTTRDCSCFTTLALARIVQCLIATLAFAFISINSHAMQALEPNITNELPLEPTKSQFFDEFLIAKNPQIASFKKIYIEDPTVSFDKRWLRDHKYDVETRYKDRIIKNYALELKRQLEKSISNHKGYQLVDGSGDGVITIRARLVNLDINGPDNSAFVEHYVTEAGDATFEVDIVNPQGLVIAKIKDHRETRYRGFGVPERTSRVQNHRDFRILMSKWSKKTIEHIAKQ